MNEKKTHRTALIKFDFLASLPRENFTMICLLPPNNFSITIGRIFVSGETRIFLNDPGGSIESAFSPAQIPVQSSGALASSTFAATNEGGRPSAVAKA